MWFKGSHVAFYSPKIEQYSVYSVTSSNVGLLPMKIQSHTESGKTPCLPLFMHVCLYQGLSNWWFVGHITQVGYKNIKDVQTIHIFVWLNGLNHVFVPHLPQSFERQCKIFRANLETQLGSSRCLSHVRCDTSPQWERSAGSAGSVWNLVSPRRKQPFEKGIWMEHI